MGADRNRPAGALRLADRLGGEERGLELLSASGAGVHAFRRASRKALAKSTNLRRDAGHKPAVACIRQRNAPRPTPVQQTRTKQVPELILGEVRCKRRLSDGVKPTALTSAAIGAGRDTSSFKLVDRMMEELAKERTQ